jgi:hypothetical protein
MALLVFLTLRNLGSSGFAAMFSSSLAIVFAAVSAAGPPAATRSRCRQPPRSGACTVRARIIRIARINGRHTSAEFYAIR